MEASIATEALPVVNPSQSAPRIIRENNWYPLSEVLERSLTDRDVQALHLDLSHTSHRIKKDLGLRSDPFAFEARATGWFFRTTGVAGTLRLLGTEFQIVPKFVEQDAFAGAWQSSLLAMLDRTRGKHFTYSPFKKVKLEKASFIDHVALAYADALEAASSEDPIQVYQVQEEVSHWIRGRFAISRQLQNVLDRPHLICCDVDYLDTDNIFNRLFHWAGRRLYDLASNTQVRRRLDDAMEKLPIIVHPPRLPLALPSSVPSQYRHYSEPFEIAQMLAKGYAHGQTWGRYSGYGYILNMETLFERFVEKTLLHLCTTGTLRATVQPQDSRLYAEPVGHGGSAYYTRPDNVLYRDGKPILLVDSKYKKFGEGDGNITGRPQNSDIYQLFAAMVAHCCDKGLLVYPRNLSDRELSEGKAKFWRIKHQGRLMLICAVVVDVSNLASRADLSRLDKRVSEFVEEAIQFQP